MSETRQADFAQALLHPRDPVPAGLAVARGGSVERRFSIYRNNVVVGLVDALAATFPSVHRIVGEEFFRAAASEFARSRPPTSPVLLSYGAGFAAFLAAFEPAATLPYLADVARLEYAWLDAFNAADRDPIDPAVLGAIPPDALADIQLELHPSVHVIRSQWPVIAIWQANCEGGDNDLASLPDEAQDALICRPRREVIVRHLPAGGAVFVTALGNREPLRPAAERAGTAHPDFDLAANIAGLLEAGALIGLVAPELSQNA